ncbi:MAG: hypothetical protein R3B70_00520 [Polyangiaceae bacterium]
MKSHAPAAVHAPTPFAGTGHGLHTADWRHPLSGVLPLHSPAQSCVPIGQPVVVLVVVPVVVVDVVLVVVPVVPVVPVSVEPVSVPVSVSVPVPVPVPPSPALPASPPPPAAPSPVLPAPPVPSKSAPLAQPAAHAAAIDRAITHFAPSRGMSCSPSFRKAIVTIADLARKCTIRLGFSAARDGSGKISAQ